MDLDVDACYRAFSTRDARFDGRLFGGVRTTRVYCRPICPARMPKRENMTFYATAAAAHEAGFRPCLRCRPETAPEFAAWRGTSNTVSRALALIDAGALDEAGIDRLAERLGVGERQLRRLFRQHLGASPVSVAQTRRVLLAKQLIHGTRLSMAEVALASGFGSIRRFNEIFHGLFGRPPGALRHVTVADDLSGAKGEVFVLVGYRPPYDWSAMASFLGARAIPGIEVVSSDRYARTIELEGAHGIVAVEPVSGNALRVAIRFSRLSALPTIIARVRRVFDVAADPQAICTQLAKDPVLAPLVAARPGLRVPGAWDGFELAVRAVLAQHITVAAAVSLAGRLVACYGQPLAEDLETEGLTHVFPRPEQLAAADLTALTMPRMRAATLAALAAGVVADPTVLGAGRSLAECVAQLRALPGLGEWTAQYIAMRELGEPDAFPAGDIGLLRAVTYMGGEGRTSSELLARAERWRPWRAYAAQHLWTSGPRSPVLPRQRVAYQTKYPSSP
jgi:AraC family transcriptional regulator, regulatory protein of adaptative response / DNA-3-methyladenine glycosylase II